jgi:hypothetical protein
MLSWRTRWLRFGTSIDRRKCSASKSVTFRSNRTCDWRKSGAAFEDLIAAKERRAAKTPTTIHPATLRPPTEAELDEAVQPWIAGRQAGDAGCDYHLTVPEVFLRVFGCLPCRKINEID